MNKEIVVNNNLLSYAEMGNAGADVSLVFLHGWRSSKEVWAGVAKKMKDQGSRIFTLDLPGFGSSPLPKNPRGVGDYTEVVLGFLEKLELKNVILVGHSFGGRVAIKLAGQYSDSQNSPQPSLALREGVLRQLILVDAAGFAMDPKKKKVYGLLAQVARPFFKPRFMQGLRKYIYTKIGAEDYLATPELQETFVNVTQEDLTEDMKRIKAPTLILVGGEDKDTPAQFGQRMNSLIPNSKFIILKNAGHFSFLDQPEEFVKHLQAFIKI